MWKNWIPFRRKQKDSEIPADQVNGKENEEVNLQHTINHHAVSTGLKPQSFGSDCDNNPNPNTITVVHNEQNRSHASRRAEPLPREIDNSRTDLNRTLPNRPSLKEHLNQGASSGNRSFTAVHGPLLSTPIMPKVRRAIETNIGLRSPATGRTSLLSRGKPVGRSASLNYGSNNPTKTRAGQVPWVRLKRRESLGLADYISTRAPQSPNTVKIAPPMNQGLPTAPSFRSSPLIVTTEANRSRMMDTQTVVSALREKRKRFGEHNAPESMTEDISWQMSPKRRRQDSSQSNASSVSIPPMPETLPNLMPTPGTSSMIHIEHLSHQRPSTIPAVDMFPNHLKPGLGGVEQRPHEPVLSHSHRDGYNQKTADLNNSRLAQKALQSSLSSSMRARNNLSLLERGGVDLKRIRSHSSSLQRRASDASSLERSLGEPQAKSSCLQSQTISHPIKTANLEDSSSSYSSSAPSTSMSSSAPSVTTVSAPTKRKIAEGVLMRKQSLSMNSPLQSLKTIPSDGLVSTSDFKRDKQQEYQRRVLNLLQPEDKDAVSSAPSGGQALQTSVTTTALAPSIGASSLATAVPASTTAPASISSSASTSIAISASLDSLNKLVQSTSPTAGELSSAPKSDNTTTNTSASTVAPIVPLSISNPDSGVSSTSSSSTSTTGFSFGLQAQSKLPASSVPPPSSSLSTSSGFQVSFGSVASPASSPACSFTIRTGISSAPSTSVVPPVISASTTAVPSVNTFNFGAPPSTAPSQPGGFSFSANAPGNTPTATAPMAPNAQTTVAVTSLPTPTPVVQFGLSKPSGSNTITSNASSGLNAINATASGAPQAGGFTFGATAASASSVSASGGGIGGFQFGLAASQQKSLASTTLANPASSLSQTQGFSFGASQASTSTSGGSVAGFSSITQTTSAPPPSYSFSATVSSPNTTSSSLANQSAVTGGFNFGAASTLSSTTNTPTGGFRFNATQSQPSAPVSQTAVQPQPSTGINPNPGLSMFSASTTKPNATGFNFSQNPASTAQPSTFTFGATNASSSQQPGPFNSSTNTTTSVNKNLFGAPASTSNNVNTAFGAPLAGGSSFNFGAAATTTTQSPFGTTAPGAMNASTPFGTSTAAPANSGLFSFGSTTNTSTASTGAPAFGSTAANNAAIGQSPFGTGVNPSPFGAAPSSTASTMFGTPSAATASVFAPAATNQPAFGATAPSTNAFGASVTSPAFGSSTGLATAATPTPAFGSNSTTPANQPFTFGAQQPSSSTNQPAPPVFGSSMFGAGANPAASSTGGASSVFGNKTASAGSNVFGGGLGQTTATNQSTAFGASSNPSVFGSSQRAPAPAFGAGQSTNMFGAAANTSSSTPVFGAGPTQQQSSAPVFGSGAQNPATSAFGATDGFGNAKPNNVNPFGAPASTAQGAAFSFTGNQAGQNAASPFGASTTSTASSGFNFGQAAQPGTTPSGGFNFSATPATPAFQPATPNNGGFNFTPGGVSTPSFNFNATPGTPNMFTPQNPGSVHRPRIAARRGPRRGRK